VLVVEVIAFNNKGNENSKRVRDAKKNTLLYND
jgi:hypothetical protein